MAPFEKNARWMDLYCFSEALELVREDWEIRSINGEYKERSLIRAVVLQ